MDVHRLLQAIVKSDEPSVLATIIDVNGHSYRKPGACMLFKLDGEQIGTVSPGCLEQDLLERTERVWLSGEGQYEIAQYNMKPEEDAIWGESLGCGGEIRVLLEPVKGTLRERLIEAAAIVSVGRSVTMERRLIDSDITYRLRERVNDTAEQIRLTEIDNVPDRLLFTIRPRPRLVLFGVGNDSEAIYSIARNAGFQLVMADWRTGICSQERFPEAQCVIGSPSEIAEQLELNGSDYLIICSHQLQQDKELLGIALPLGLAYIGIMGSKKRIRMLFETFLMPSNVRAPIGLSIGADGPYEIAVSVVAELIAVRAGRSERARGGAKSDGHFGHLFGSWPQQADGSAQAGIGADAGDSARQNGASCASAMQR
ncbi:XdhC family protein [Paenibacillus harenae]|uniref:XdhC family protein n=1 Tax=Paenibacillus harenae TaxID=306543 RepID=UPI002794ECFA|nr:XdhC family protein [Paenibacillus harenae]MDQ0059815.1 xanthine dehydrogenase accessory factor [Paenibacillus harenae]